MASKKLLDMLNNALAGELQVSIQYMWQHVQWVGIKGLAVQEELKKIAITEMKHAEAIAERLNYLGGTPTTKPAEIYVGKTLKEMIERDIKDEENAIKLYKEIIAQARSENDITTAFILEEILKDEEEHHDTFTTLMEEI
ncbi:MAG: ferritin-like domain-containing protein [Nitrososphaerota archaeon]|nr:ferritin-like domain-containing protein [Candidatus Bathyarchaeota archaeon]MDW8048756.1 ferritin-like domain-containing protein [Nitrososphaerota archaeon]